MPPRSAARLALLTALLPAACATPAAPAPASVGASAAPDPDARCPIAPAARTTQAQIRSGAEPARVVVFECAAAGPEGSLDRATETLAHRLASLGGVVVDVSPGASGARVTARVPASFDGYRTVITTPGRFAMHAIDTAAMATLRSSPGATGAPVLRWEDPPYGPLLFVAPDATTAALDARFPIPDRHWALAPP